MSNEVNDDLMERAREAVENSGDVKFKQRLADALEKNDLEEVRWLLWLEKTIEEAK